MSIPEFLTDLFNPDLAFLPKAMLIAVMSSIVCGVVGCYVVLRGMAFIGHAVAHAVFPGLAVAFVLQGSLVLGGAVAGVVTALLMVIFSQNRRIKEDSIIGVLHVAAFAVGIVIISQAPGYAGSLQQFLFGSITGIPDEDLYLVGITGVSVLAIVFLLHKEFVAVSLDREMARSMGLKVFWLDIALYVMVTVAIVIAVQTIGNILVLALLLTPAATARLLTDRLAVMMLLAPVIGGSSAIVGLYLSWSYDLPVGGTIVLVLTAVFLLAWTFAPRHGAVARSSARVRKVLSVNRDADDYQADAERLREGRDLSEHDDADQSGGGGQDRDQQRVRGTREPGHGELVTEVRDDR
ncbi:anchored repeat-type ABC transporter permease subunit [Phytoactinopolyspora sp. XMNu-373]|uniref:Anchored repeat-type ABC transporter permease subunit n=1 Tax=Phytoactinopolyspora mesophila TaxID=2650750 RepID=A0A7K3MAY9_9ACTN|nr:anchored repeat-type ABC transporter permease subunit [Phytoactinopolyspora mesophila]